MILTQTRWLPVLLLVCSNVFMTVAWYGHLKFKDKPLWIVIVVSWSIAFLEYCFQVPANRWGSANYTPFQTQGDPGDRHAHGFCDFCFSVFSRKISLESLGGDAVPGGGGDVRVYAKGLKRRLAVLFHSV